MFYKKEKTNQDQQILSEDEVDDLVEDAKIMTQKQVKTDSEQVLSESDDLQKKQPSKKDEQAKKATSI